jgi:superoxide dismutase, Cu-Zn family
MTRGTTRLGVIGTALTVVAVFALAGTSGAGDSDAKAKIKTTTGSTVGVAELEQEGSRVVVKISASGLTPGFHGFHVHTTGKCTNPDGTANFALAGGHYAGANTNHGEHVGDLPSLLVNGDGTARMRFTTNAFTIADLLAGDGSAFVIHDGRDNYANIGSRYVSNDAAQTGADYSTFTGHLYTNGPDLASLKTGDAGGRKGCGVIKSD